MTPDEERELRERFIATLERFRVACRNAADAASAAAQRFRALDEANSQGPSQP